MTTRQSCPGEEITEAALEPESRAVVEDIPAERIPRVPDASFAAGDGVYRSAAWAYRQAGWLGVLPLPPGAKLPPPKGFTGHEGRWPTDEQIAQWIVEVPADANLMLRVNYGVIGIDVDAYDSKTGGRTLDEAERVWGALPLTYRSSARSMDMISGVRVFRVPENILFRDRIKFGDLNIGDIEIIQPHHRYITAYPSVHPKTACQYRWYGLDGTQLPDGQVPRANDLPALPATWVEALSRDTVREAVFDESAPNRTLAQRERINEELYNELLRLDDGRAPEPLVAARLEKAISDLTNGQGSRYDTTRDHVAALMRLHSVERAGVPEALRKLFSVYVMEVSDTRPPAVAVSEFLRFTAGAAALVAANMPDVGPGSSERPSHGHGEGAVRGEGVEERPSWGRVDLGPLLGGDQGAPVPTLFPRGDGVCLLYPGLVHSVHGESESGKSLILQLDSVRLINLGKDVLYVDCESDPRSVLRRLVEFGAKAEAVIEHFHYVQPQATPNSSAERAAWELLLAGRYELAVIDGVTDALSLFGYATKDNDDVTKWMREVPKMIASRTGAAVVLIDHVTKDQGGRGRWAIGGQAKMAALTGAAYTVEVDKPLGRGLRGIVVLRVGKDRPGEVRGSCGPFRKGDRTQEAARVIVDSTCSPPRVSIEAPTIAGGVNDGGSRAFRPTTLMQRASEAVEREPSALTKNQLAKAAGGNKQATLKGVDILMAEGYVRTEPGPSRYPVYVSVKPYRETEDSLSDRYLNLGNGLLITELVPGSRFLERGTGEPVQSGSTEPIGTTENHLKQEGLVDDEEEDQRSVRSPLAGRA